MSRDPECVHRVTIAKLIAVVVTRAIVLIGVVVAAVVVVRMVVGIHRYLLRVSVRFNVIVLRREGGLLLLVVVVVVWWLGCGSSRIIGSGGDGGGAREVVAVRALALVRAHGGRASPCPCAGGPLRGRQGLGRDL